MKRSDEFAPIRELADAVISKDAGPEQFERLEQLMRGNIEAQRFYYDYMSMHARLMGAVEPNLDFVYRRMTHVTQVTEEFVVRPNDQQNRYKRVDEGLNPFSSAHIEPVQLHPTSASTQSPHNLEGAPSQEPKGDDERMSKLSVSQIFVWLTLVLIILIAIALGVTHLTSSGKQVYYAQLSQGDIDIEEQGQINANKLGAGEYQTTQDSVLILNNGSTIKLNRFSVFKIFNDNEFELKAGNLTFEPQDNRKWILHGPSFSLHAKGSGFSISLTDDKIRLNINEKLTLLPKRWRPSHFWGFDSNSDRVIDYASNAHGIPAKGATRVKGLVGQGAFEFDNSALARIDVGTGGGTAPATGSFSTVDGITIEALVAPQYSGKQGDLDEIFRKDGGDAELRVLFSFQNDLMAKDYLRPEGDFGPSLSFGLFIVGQGYHELKLPLDGQNGRPTLAEMNQDNSHHVAATYNARTGVKAIYINGQRLAHYQYPPGSKMLSGGPGKAAIGNNPAQHRWSIEAFSGVIDEVAFYDFALTPYMLHQHSKHAELGLNYFGMPSNSESLPEQIKLSLPPSTSITLDPFTGLPIAQE